MLKLRYPHLCSNACCFGYWLLFCNSDAYFTFEHENIQNICIYAIIEGFHKNSSWFQNYSEIILFFKYEKRIFSCWFSCSLNAQFLCFFVNKMYMRIKKWISFRNCEASLPSVHIAQFAHWICWEIHIQFQYKAEENKLQYGFVSIFTQNETKTISKMESMWWFLVRSYFFV